MKHAILILLALVCAASAQTYKTVTAESNNAIRTNFTITGAKVVGTVPMASNVTGIVAITNGGTGASTASSALAALLPSYASNSGKVLTVNFGATGVEWSTNSSGGGGGVTGVDVSGGSTGLTFSGGPITNSGTITMAGKLSITNGGTGGTNTNSALIGLGILKDYGETVRIGGPNTFAQQSAYKSVVIGDYATAQKGYSVSIGNGSGVFSNAEYGIAIGNGAYVQDKDGAGYAGAAVSPNGGVQGLGGALGYSADVYGDGGSVGLQTYSENGGSIGKWAYSTDGFAGGYDSTANGTNNIQIGQGTNNDEYTIQIYSAGTVDTNEWARLASLSTYPTTNISVTGTNNTNTLVFSNGILVEVQ